MKTGSRMFVMALGALGATGIAMAQCGAGQGPGNGRRCAQSCTTPATPPPVQQRRQDCEQPCSKQRERPRVQPARTTLSDALVTQLQGTLADEFLTRDFYRAAAARFGMPRFTNHERAEQHHIAALTAILRDAGVTPVTAAGRATELPTTLVLTEQRIAELEADMIRAYERLLELGKDTQLMPTLQNIQAANRRHLQAATGGDGGNGRGNRQGRGPGNGNGDGQGTGNRQRGRRQNRGSEPGCGVDSGEQCAPTSRSCRR